MNLALIDCGNLEENGPNIACAAGLEKHKPDIFVLSHFHADHYNGLQVADSDSQTLKKVYYPRIPDFAEREEYVLYNIAMANRTYGHLTGSFTADLLRNVKRINKCDFEFVELYRGQEISFGGQEYEVLWPPRELSDPKKELGRAIETFERALEEDEYLRRITNELRKRETLSDYYDDLVTHEPVFQDKDGSEERILLQERELPKITQQANKRLRKATDRMSLAFHNPDRLLFLGDLKPGELRDVTEYLVELSHTHYDILISPHHGTRYSTAMVDLEANWTVSSLGKQYLESVDTRIRDIGYQNWITYLDGDFSRPIYSASALSARHSHVLTPPYT